MENEGLTAQSIKVWLTKYSVEQPYNGYNYYDILSDKLYLSPPGIPAKYPNDHCIKIEEQSDKQGTYTEGLFFIYTNLNCLSTKNSDEYKLVFIIKELTKGTEEIENLKKVEKILPPKIKNNKMPQFAFTEDFFYYISRTDYRIHYFSVIHAATGKALADILESGNFNDVKTAFQKLGATLANFHLLHMDKTSLIHDASKVPSYYLNYYKTWTHNDLHPKNVFYNKNFDRITFIDNETYAYSINDKKNITYDIQGIIFTPVYYWKSYDNCFLAQGMFRFLNDDNIIEKVDTCEKQLIAYKAFFKSYINEYPEEERDLLKEYLALYLETVNTYILLQQKNDVIYTSYLTLESSVRINDILNQLATYLRTL
jgi:hypothetical protein